MRGDEKRVEMLIEAGADVNAPGGEHGTTLYVASRRHRGIMEMLVDTGAVE